MSNVVKKELPENWAWTTMDNISDVVGGGTPISKEKRFYQNGSIPWLTPADLSGYKEKYVSNGARFITEDGLNSSSAKIMPAGTVLFTSRAPIGYVVIAKNEICTNQGFKSFVIKSDKILPDYVYWWLKGSKQLAESFASGTTFLELSGSKAKQLPIPIAPLEQQKRIVAKIEELFSHIDAGIEALNKAKQLLKQYRQSVLKAAVTGELLGYKFSEEMFKPIDFGLETLGQGWSPRCEKEPSPSEDTWGVIKTTAVQSLEYRQEENKRLPDSLEPRPKHEILVGDLLVTRAGPRVRVGICCLVKETRKKLMICDKVYRLRVKKGVILPEYLAIILNAPNVLIEVEKLKSGINDSGVNLTQNKFIQLQIPYPLIEDQKSLTQIVTDKVDSISRLDEDIEKQMLKAEKNKQSILASAFSGELGSA